MIYEFYCIFIMYEFWIWKYERRWSQKLLYSSLNRSSTVIWYFERCVKLMHIKSSLYKNICLKILLILVVFIQLLLVTDFLTVVIIFRKTQWTVKKSKNRSFIYVSIFLTFTERRLICTFQILCKINLPLFHNIFSIDPFVLFCYR